MDAKRRGRYLGRVEPAQFSRLAKLVVEGGYFELNDRYRAGVTKGWTLLNFVLVILFLIAAALLMPLIYFLGFWLKGANTLAFPGQGLLLPTPLLVVALTTAEVAVLLLAAYLVRYTPIMQMLYSGGD